MSAIVWRADVRKKYWVEVEAEAEFLVEVVAAAPGPEGRMDDMVAHYSIVESDSWNYTVGMEEYSDHRVAAGVAVELQIVADSGSEYETVELEAEGNVGVADCVDRPW